MGTLTPQRDALFLAIIQQTFSYFRGFLLFGTDLQAKQQQLRLVPFLSSSYLFVIWLPHWCLTTPSTSKCCHYGNALLSPFSFIQTAQKKLLTSRLANLIFILSVSTIYNNTESLAAFLFSLCGKQAQIQWKLHSHYFYGSYFSVIMSFYRTFLANYSRIMTQSVAKKKTWPRKWKKIVC